MTVFKHELRQGWKSLLVWTASIGFLMAVCIFLFPEMKGEMEGVSHIFASMGGFTAAFGMDRLNFGEFHGFYAVECGNILGLGGAFFAALIAVAALCKEEKEHTAEFLLAHPVTRTGIVTAKLLSVLAELLILNGAILLLTVLSVLAIGVLAFTVSNLSFVDANTPFTSQFTTEIYNIRTLVDLGGVAILYAFHIQHRELHMKYELDAIHNVLETQYVQYLSLIHI